MNGWILELLFKVLKKNILYTKVILKNAFLEKFKETLNESFNYFIRPIFAIMLCLRWTRAHVGLEISVESLRYPTSSLLLQYFHNYLASLPQSGFSREFSLLTLILPTQQAMVTPKWKHLLHLIKISLMREINFM